jgi:pentatricopeptide repeat protein
MQPNKEIYGCIANLLARAGRLREAFDLIDRMPLAPDESVWGMVLGACKIHKNLELAKLVANKIFEINPAGADLHPACKYICGRWQMGWLLFDEKVVERHGKQKRGWN